MIRSMLTVALCWVSLISFAQASGHPGVAPVGSWCFLPEYVLPQSARNEIGPSMPRAISREEVIEYEPKHLRFKGLQATDARWGLLDSRSLPTGPFTMEMWVIDHVNQPVGVLAAAKRMGGDGRPVDDVAWSLGYGSGEVMFGLGNDPDHRLRTGVRPLAYKKWWYHIVATYDGAELVIWVNGTRFGGLPVPSDLLRYEPDSALDVTGYFEHEPYMQIGNLLHWAWVIPEAYTAEHVRSRFDAFRYYVDEGLIAPGIFHFNAGPYLNNATKHTMSILWETDRAATAEVSYGMRSPLDKKVSIDEPARIQEITLDGLEPGESYYYRVTAKTSDGATIDSGLLTFKTAVEDEQAYTFAVIGDTEARPHINDRVAKLIWDERPDFVVNCGDLTDGGREPRKFEWNHEYFLGMNQLHSRVPAFPVAGNGESDLYWYNRYHVLPEPEGYYSFRYGNAEFFMLDSNQREESFKAGGEQFEWLREKLAASDATWKFVAHHHPVYTSDEDDFGDTFRGDRSPLGDLNVRRMTELYERYGVDAVFFGHLHTYERSWPVAGGKVDLDRGVIYVQSGGAGGNLEDFTPTRNWFKNNTMRGHHYCTFNIMGGHLEMKMFDLNGAMRDTFVLDKPMPVRSSSVQPGRDGADR